MEPPSSDPPALDQIVPLKRVVDLLSPALGTEKSTELVLGAARQLKLNANQLTLARTLEILMALAVAPGVIGVAARFARMRLLGRVKKNSSGPHAQADAATLPPDAPIKIEATVDSPRVESAELVELLAHTVGTEKAWQLVGAVMAEFGLMNTSLDRDQALGLLDALARAQGVVGIAARFAKARLIFRFGTN